MNFFLVYWAVYQVNFTQRAIQTLNLYNILVPIDGFLYS